MPVVVVESPAKAKTIENFLGKDYTVLASFGHVRDLAEKEGSVNPDHNFAMKWEVPARARRHIKAIADALQKDKALILATDPDREGEAISWHLEEALRARKAIREDTTVDRIAFNSVTRRSLTEAMETRARSTVTLSRPILPAARWTTWLATRSRRYFGESCPAQGQRAACSPCACDSSSSAKWKWRRSGFRNTGPSRRSLPRLEGRSSRRA